jgi:hypothetical protein
MIGTVTKWCFGILTVLLFQSALFAQSGINAIGSFEQTLPSYWTKLAEPTGATLTWATDESRSMGKSLKITKTATSEAAIWESENMADLWSEKHFANVDINLGMYYKTSGVNTNPANEDQKWYVLFSFYRENGTLIGEKKFELDQSVASTTGWVADTTAIGELSLPEDSWKTIIRFVGGKDATGTVWTDDFILTGRGGWAGQDWNTAVGVPTGWFYWLPPNGGNDGILNQGYENTVVTNEFAYDGTYSLKFNIPVGTHDGFVGTRRYEFDSLQPGDVARYSVWIKGANLQPDSAIAVGDAWSISITAIYHSTIGNNEGWGQYDASPDIPLVFPNATSFDWTQFTVYDTVPEPPSGQTAKSISVRLHPLGRWSGTVWMDKLEVGKGVLTGVDDNVIPVSAELFQNYPNPFNPSTVISYAIPNVTYVSLKIYDLLGREVKTLVNTEQSSGVYNVQWNGDNNAGVKVSSGTYLYRIEAGDFKMSRKLTLLK